VQRTSAKLRVVTFFGKETPATFLAAGVLLFTPRCWLSLPIAQ